MLHYLFTPQILITLVALVIGYALFRTILSKLLPRWLVWGVAILVITGIIPFQLVASVLSSTIGYVATTSVHAVAGTDTTSHSKVASKSPKDSSVSDSSVTERSMSTAGRIFQAILGSTPQASSNWARAAH